MSERTATSRTWVMPSGRRVTQVASEPVQWRDGRGEWHDYDLSLRTGGPGWVAQPGRMAIELPAELSRSEAGAVRVADEAGNSVAMTFVGAPAEGSATTERAIYSEVADGVDLELRPIPGGLKEDVVLRDRDSSRDLRYRVTVDDADLVLEEDGAGGLRVRRGPQVVFVIPAPTLLDGEGVAGFGGRFEARASGERSWIVETVLPEWWLDAENRAWPVVVDPTVRLWTSTPNDDCTIGVQKWDTGRSVGPFWACNAYDNRPIGRIYSSGLVDLRQQLLRFDTLTPVQGDVIETATLKLYRMYAGSPDIPFGVHRVLTYWDTSAMPWASAGGGYWADRVPVARVDGGVVGSVNVDLTALAQDWSSDPSTNRGVFLNPENWPMPNQPCEDCDTVHWYRELEEGQDPPAGAPASGWTWLSSSTTPAPTPRPVVEVTSWPAAAAGNAVISPGEGDLTGKRVPLQARALASSVRTVRFQYVAGSQRRWTDIPLSALSTPTRGTVGSIDVPVSGPTGDRTSELVIWDVSAVPGGDVDGPVHVRAWLESPTAGDGGMTDEVNFRLDRRGIDGAPLVSIGPGELNLLSGDFSMQQTDASVKAFVQDLTLTRTYRSRGVSVRNADMFGSGWEAGVEADGGELPYKGIYNYSEIKTNVIERQVLRPETWNWELYYETFDYEDLLPDIETLQESESFNYEYLVVEGSYGEKMTFTQIKDPSGRVTDWTPDDLHAGFTLTRRSVTADTFEITVTDPDGYVATFRSEAPNSPNYRLTSFKEPGNTTALSYTYEASGTRQRLKRVTAPQPSGGAARSLTFTWSSVGTPSLPRVTSVVFDDGHGNTSTLASYSYDTNARLIQVTDPRIASSARNWRYHYNAAGQLDQVTSSGEATWNLAYSRISGDSGPRLTSVSRAHPDGGTATRTVRYAVPLAGGGAPYDMSTAETAKWDQVDDLPWDAVAIWPEDTVPDPQTPDYRKATVYYVGLQGLMTNVAEPGGAISTFKHDARGNVIRELGAQGRAAALAAGASSATHAVDRSTLYTYDARSVDLTSTREPMTQITLSDGRVVTGRRITTINYDQNNPGGGPFHLPTSRFRAVETASGTFDSRETVRYSYAGEGGMSGWTARHATKTVVDPTGKALTSYSILHGTYPIVEETRTPGSPGGGSNADVQWHQYYGIPTTRVPAGISGANSGCSTYRGPNHPAGFLCLRSEATLPDAQVPRRWYDYLPLGDRLAVWEPRPLTWGGAGYRYTGFRYDGAGQLTDRSVNYGTGTAVPATTFSYDPATGQQTQARSSVGTITRVFDSNGRLSSYTDASGTVTTYRYDLRGRRTSMTVDGVTTTYAYDDRNNLTSVTDSAVGTAVTASYDLDGQLASESLPNGLVMMQLYDETGRPSLMSWTQTDPRCRTNCTWARSEITNRDADGRTRGQRTNDTQETLSYDSVGRLTQTDAVRLSDNRCVRKTYAYDGGGVGDSNRTSSSTWTSSPGSACGTGAPTTRTLTYDAADRISSSGWTWDYFGRATAVPATDSGGTGALSASYYVNDMVRQLTLDGRTHTYTRDALDRTQSIASSGASKPTLTETYRYSDDSDEPEKITVSSGAVIHDVEGPSGLVVATSVGGTLTYKLRDLQGSVVATTAAGGSPSARTEYDPFGMVTTAAPNVISWTYGDPDFGWLGAHQRATQFGQAGVGAAGPVEMGARVYLPKVGRFLQVDPIDGASWNAYDYAFQDPTNMADLNGLGPMESSLGWLASQFQSALARVTAPATWLLDRCTESWRSGAIAGFGEALWEKWRDDRSNRELKWAKNVVRNIGPRSRGFFKLQRDRAVRILGDVVRLGRNATLFGVGVNCVFGGW